MLNQLQLKLIIKLNLIFFMIKIEVYKKKLKLNKLERKQPNIMKKFFISIVVLIFLSCNTYADKLLNSGYLVPTKKWEDEIKIDETFQISGPKDKIVIIYNHGSDSMDHKTKNCAWVNQLRNFAQLAGDVIKGKEILVYLNCQGHLEGDLGATISNIKYFTSKWEGPYPGISKMDRRVEGNLELVKKFVNIGVPKKQIIITGHSCGGWATLLFTAKHMNEVGGGIALMPACNYIISKKMKVKKIGIEKALDKLRKNYPGIASLREKHINTMVEGNAPVLIFTHPMDHYEGLTSDWMNDVPNFNRIVISNDRKINGKKCKVSGKNWSEPVKKNTHTIDYADCFLFYHPIIKEYIASRIK